MKPEPSEKALKVRDALRDAERELAEAEAAEAQLGELEAAQAVGETVDAKELRRLADLVARVPVLRRKVAALGARLAAEAEAWREATLAAQEARLAEIAAENQEIDAKAEAAKATFEAAMRPLQARRMGLGAEANRLRPAVLTLRQRPAWQLPFLAVGEPIPPRAAVALAPEGEQAAA